MVTKSKHILIKIEKKNKEKGKILKLAKEKQHIKYKGTLVKLSANF